MLRGCGMNVARMGCRSMSSKRKVLIVCAQCDAQDVGENWCGFEWVSRLAKSCDVTVLTQRFPGHPSPAQQLAGLRVIEWPATGYFAKHPRFNSAAKPWYPAFYIRARRWIKDAIARGEHFDILHQIMPMATRYPSPCAGLGIPFVFGPVGGGVETPAGFRKELGTEPGYVKLRDIDGLRLRHDPFLRNTYQQADSIICCSGYVADRLRVIETKRIDLEYEVGFDTLEPPHNRPAKPSGEMKMLYVGRIIRTKGLRDAIRAMAQVRDLEHVTLDVAGAGEDMDACRAEAEQLGVASRINFLGRLPRADLEPLYASADLFLFPSFREPTGGVLFECMRHGLPAIVASNGGPGHIVTEECGVRVDPVPTERFATDIATAIRRLAMEPGLRQAMGHAARDRIADLGLWDRKLARIHAIYDAVLAGTSHKPHAAHTARPALSPDHFEHRAAAKRAPV
jgi:glycosyltransferase involved in cell wall biosynthesis